MIREYSRSTANGLLVIPVLLGVHLFGVVLLLTHALIPAALGVVLEVVAGFCWLGLFMVHPNQGRVLQLFGAYRGTERAAGLRWANPFLTKRSVSLRVRNFDSDRLKVNDLHGSPIEIGAVVVWQVVDTAEAVFEVDDYEDFVQIQSEAALRGLATRYPYDLGDEEEGASLRGSAEEVSNQLAADVQARLEKAGVKVIEARISHLAYAPEIASAMLQRQQAAAVLAARRKIVEGAVGMVESALEELERKHIVQLDVERRAAMVSNLLVVLCGEKAATPVLNTGSLYH